MKIFLISILGLSIIIFIIFYIVYLYTKPNSWSPYVKIKFSDFEKWYAIAPSGWYCYDCCVSKKGNCDDLDIYCIFGFIDFYRYLLWNSRKKTSEKEKEDNARLARVLNLVQKDIDNYIKNIDKEAERCKKEYEEILNKIEKSF